jgi:hypothetical protein
MRSFVTLALPTCLSCVNGWQNVVGTHASYSMQPLAFIPVSGYVIYLKKSSVWSACAHCLSLQVHVWLPCGPGIMQAYLSCKRIRLRETETEGLGPGETPAARARRRGSLLKGPRRLGGVPSDTVDSRPDPFSPGPAQTKSLTPSVP